jgi:hypothetical protein
MVDSFMILLIQASIAVSPMIVFFFPMILHFLMTIKNL